ncbi:MAG: hypothetical protein AMS15_00365 [Planctomycetes bacterium DG_23]|nr:MAG: hypothetical protein AMS15_00365 [Planctomycetes bacterium DG_23]
MNQDKRPYISLIIPAYNEEERLGSTLEDAVRFLRGLGIAFEIIIINDGSGDATESIARDFCEGGESGAEARRFITYSINQGKGFAVSRGVENAQGQYLLICDADGSIPPSELKKFLPFAEEGYALVVGSRAVPGARGLVDQPLVRRILGRAFSLLVATLVVRMVKDTQCGFKLLEARAARKIFSLITIKGFAFDVEMLYLARKMGLAVKEVPVRCTSFKRSRVNLFNDSWRMFCDLIKIRLGIWRGVYQ